MNQSIMDAVNATGEAFLSSTRLRGGLVLRIAIGNERTTRDDVAHAWRLLRGEAAAQSHQLRPSRDALTPQNVRRYSSRSQGWTARR